jgi:hypothetical protein
MDSGLLFHPNDSMPESKRRSSMGRARLLLALLAIVGPAGAVAADPSYQASSSGTILTSHSTPFTLTAS